MITATPTTQKSAPSMSYRSGRKPSKAIAQINEPATNTPPYARVCVAAVGYAVTSLEAALDDVKVLAKLGRLLHVSPVELGPNANVEELILGHRGASGSEGFENMLLSASRREKPTVQQVAKQQALNQLHHQPVADAAGYRESKGPQTNENSTGGYASHVERKLA